MAPSSLGAPHTEVCHSGPLKGSDALKRSRRAALHLRSVLSAAQRSHHTGCTARRCHSHPITKLQFHALCPHSCAQAPTWFSRQRVPFGRPVGHAASIHICRPKGPTTTASFGGAPGRLLSSTRRYLNKRSPNCFRTSTEGMPLVAFAVLRSARGRPPFPSPFHASTAATAHVAHPPIGFLESATSSAFLTRGQAWVEGDAGAMLRWRTLRLSSLCLNMVGSAAGGGLPPLLSIFELSSPPAHCKCIVPPPRMAQLFAPPCWTELEQSDDCSRERLQPYVGGRRLPVSGRISGNPSPA